MRPRDQPRLAAPALEQRLFVKPPAEQADELLVDLHDVQLVARLEKVQNLDRHGAGTGTNFEDA